MGEDIVLLPQGLCSYPRREDWVNSPRREEWVFVIEKAAGFGDLPFR